jgi:hypothetical protein
MTSMTDEQVHTHGADHLHDHDHDHEHEHEHRVEARPPTVPSQSVLVDVGELAGALVLSSTAEREGIEVEIHPASDPAARTHVWVLPRRGPGGVTVYAAVFPSLVPGDYVVLAQEGESGRTVQVPANRVTFDTWT